jgi:hypothetical protein
VRVRYELAEAPGSPTIAEVLAERIGA